MLPPMLVLSLPLPLALFTLPLTLSSVMVALYLSHPLALLISHIISILIMFLLLQTLLRISFPFVSLPLTITVVWNLILLAVL